MADIPYWMNYVIFFKDDAEYQFATAVAGGNLLEMAPRDAAALFGIPFPYPSGDMDAIQKGIYFLFPFSPGTQIGFPGPTGVFVDDTILTVHVNGQAGNPPSIWPAGPGATFTWSANIVKQGAAGYPAEPIPNAIPQRRWIGGRELTGPQGEGGTSITARNISRDASRTIDGFGVMVRGNAGFNSWLRNVDDFRTGLVTRTSWERFYVRFRKFPATQTKGIWRCHGTPSNTAGAMIKISPSGDLRLVDVNAVGSENDKGSIMTPVLNEWYRFDVLLRYGGGGGGGNGIIQIYVNGLFALGFSASDSFGMDSNTSHTSSEITDVSGATDVEIELDMDDWINADLPGNCDPNTLGFIDTNFPIDWLMGSHVRFHNNDAVSQTNWSPAAMGKGVTNQHISPDTRLGTSVLTSTTSGATLEVLTDVLPQSTPDSLANVFGAVAAIVSYRNINSGGTDGQLGYRIAGGAPVLATINQTTTEASQLVAYLPSGMILPTEISPFSLTHTKSLDANTDTAIQLMCVVEYIGVWGPEDDPLFDFPINRLSFLHNCRYGNTPWGYLGSQPAAPVYAIGGTYVGNGTYQEFTLPAPAHMIWTRALTSPSGGMRIFAADNGAHFGGTDRTVPNIRTWYDFIAQTFKWSVVGGASSDVNVSGTTYQYIIFCDPGMRFNLCGQYCHGGSAATPRANPLIDTGFLAECGFATFIQMNIVSNASGMYFRGPGFTGNNGHDIVAGNIQANFGTFSAGFYNNGSLTQQGSGPYNYSLWRTQDSGGACAGIMVQIMQYTGNGSNPRTITLTPTSGRFPLLVCVIPATASGQAFMRDPSHTGSNSCQIGSQSNSTTAITAVPAVDQITVNSSLNANGVVYSVFAICGDSAGMNNGVFIGDFCEGGGPYIPPNPPQGDINVLGNGGVNLDGTTPLTLLRDISGIYTLITGKRNDTLIDRQTGQPNVDVEIPDPTFKTGYVGG